MKAARLPAAQRRRQLLDVARTVFADQGYHDSAMNDISEAAGVTKPVLYQHFGSKQDLFAAVLADTGERLSAAVLSAARQASVGRAQVESAFAAYIGFARTDPAGFRLLHSGSWQTEPTWLETARTFEELWSVEVAGLINLEGLSPERRLILAHGLIGLAEGVMRHWLNDPGPQSDPEELVELLTDLAWGGLATISP